MAHFVLFSRPETSTFSRMFGRGFLSEYLAISFKMYEQHLGKIFAHNRLPTDQTDPRSLARPQV